MELASPDIGIDVLKQFIEHAPQSIAIFDNNMRYLVANPRWIRDYGLKGQDIIGHSHYEIFPEIGDDWKQIHQDVLNGAVNINERAPFPRADGSLDWIRWEVRPWHKFDGTVGGIMMYTEVITAEVEAEEAQQQVNRYQSLIDQNPNYVLFIDKDLKVEYINQVTSEVRAQLIGLDYATMISRDPNQTPRLIEEQIRVIKNTLKHGTINKWQVPGIGSDGNLAWYETTVFPVKLDNAIVGAGMLSQNISELRQAQAALVQQREQLRLLIDAIPDLIYQKDADGVYVMANKAFADIHGLNPNQVLGKTDVDCGVSPETVEEFNANNLKVMADGTIREY
ncbi:MAG: PAS domain-containing protein, partial [Chloroflexota bacterium]